MGEQTLGELIDNNRRDKHMTVAQLVAQANLSQATYNRMRKDRADIKLPATLALLDALRLQVADVSPVLKHDYMTNETWQERLAATAEQVVRRQEPLAALTDLRAALIASRDHQLAQSLLVLYADLLVAKVQDHQSVAQQVAQQLYTQLAPAELWTRFEYQLAITCISYLDWAQMQALYAHFFAAVAPTAPLEHLFDDAYLAMMAAVLTRGEPVPILTVAVWWQNRQLLADNYTFALYRQFLPCCRAWLAGQHTQAQQAWTTLETTVKDLDGTAMTAYHQVLRRFWQLLQRVAQAPAKAACAALDCAHHTAVPPALPEWLAQVRQGKRIPVEALWQAMYLSKAAYYRQFTKLSSMKTSECFMALNSLRIESADLDERVETIGLNVAATQRQLQAVVAQVGAQKIPASALTVWQTRLQTTYQQTENVGYQQLGEWLAVIQAECAHQGLKARLHALRLYKQLIQYDNWTAFEYSLLVTILPYLPFSQGQFLFTHYLEAASQRPARVAGANEQDLDLIYLGLLNSAIAENDASAVTQALTWISQRWLSSRTVAFRIYQRAADCWLADPLDAAAINSLCHRVQATFGAQAQNVVLYLEKANTAITKIMKGVAAS